MKPRPVAECAFRVLDRCLKFSYSDPCGAVLSLISRKGSCSPWFVMSASAYSAVTVESSAPDFLNEDFCYTPARSSGYAVEESARVCAGVQSDVCFDDARSSGHSVREAASLCRQDLK